jgi:hypothetical protein
MKSFLFWDITPCSPLKFNRRFAETALLATCFTLFSCLAYSATLKMEAIFLPKHLFKFSGLHGIIFQNTELFFANFLFLAGLEVQIL